MMIFLLGVLGLLGVFLWLLWLPFHMAIHWSEWTRRKRLAVPAIAIAVVVCPYLAFKIAEHRFVLARVPKPLQVATIEYRQEFGGIGGPGDNEVGLVVYRLTDGSAGWARARGAELGDFLPGGAEKWLPTPVDDTGLHYDTWHSLDDERGRPKTPHPADLAEFANKYGYHLPAGKALRDEVNRAIRSPGAFYAYGEGGSITIIDPAHSKVYFAYAG